MYYLLRKQQYPVNTTYNTAVGQTFAAILKLDSDRSCFTGEVKIEYWKWYRLHLSLNVQFYNLFYSISYTCVVYFDQLVELLFCSRFQPFLFFLNLFQWFHAWNKQKTSENEQKMCFCLLLKAGRHAEVGRGGTSKLSFSVDI